MANDMFLKITGPNVKGESGDKSHKDEVELLSFHWSGQSPRDSASGMATGKFNAHPLVITKKVDLSSPMLIKSAVQNETYKEVTLTVRKPGGTPLEYLVIKLTNATVASFDIIVDHSDVATSHTETIMLTYQKLHTTYTSQKGDGKAGPSTNFEYDWQSNQGT